MHRKKGAQETSINVSYYYTRFLGEGPGHREETNLAEVTGEEG